MPSKAAPPPPASLASEPPSQASSPQLTQQMAIFAEVVGSGSFTRAADRLGLAKSTVSKQVRSLEQHLGVRLLHRQTRKLTLTEEGNAILPHCQQLGQGAEQALQTLAQLKGAIEGILRVSIPPMIGEQLMQSFIPSFLQLYPDLKLQIDMTEAITDLVDEGFDLALRVGSVVDDRYVAKEIGSLWAHLVASPDYLQQYGTPEALSDLCGYHCLIWGKNPEDFSATWPLHCNNKYETVDVSAKLVSSSVPSLKTAAVQGLGVTLLPYYSTRKEVEQGTLQVILEDYKTSTSPI